MKQNILYILWGCIALVALAACQDEFIEGGGRIPEGETTIRLTTQFKAMEPALTRTNGQAIQTIESLYVLLYDAGTGKLVESYDNASFRNVVDDNHTNTAAPADDCKKFDLTVPYGIYRIYAVANVDNFLTTHATDIQTEDGLKKIKFNWDNDVKDVAKNKQMFGYFTTSSTDTPNGFAAPEITINQANMTLHAWLRRLASKITVAFDGTKLNENVFIYIKSVTIKDIPKQCYLGQVNAPAIDGKANPTAEEKSQILWESGETIAYGTGNDHTKWLQVTKGGAGIGGKEGIFGSDHSAGADALFFYENMQGTGTEKEKYQDADGDGQTDDKKVTLEGAVLKDNKPYGTFIEVVGYYDNTETLSRGEIVYRFMLGKNISNDFNAERNFHYKLTLMFNKDANNPDWHIEYDEDDGIYAPNPYYISYDYNQPMLGGLPIRISGELKKGSKINVSIVKNNWKPDGAGAELKDLWTGAVKSYAYNYNTGAATSRTDATGDDSGDLLWTGFLSLRDVELNMNIVDDGYGNFYYVRGTSGTAQQKSFGYRMWKRATNGTSGVDLGNISYDVSTGTPSEDGESTKFSIPLYTRPRKLWIAAGFTGANPYVAYNRTATVRVTATLANGNTLSTDIKVVQVKRLVNPAGIYRKADSDASFNVVLMEQTKEGGDFTPIESYAGPWTAEIEAGDWFTIGGTTRVTGSTGSEIRFTYKPKGVNNTGSTRCGIIKVTYHNNTCIHRIFVRQGYQSLDMGNGTKWLASNMYSKTAAAGSPLEEGSYFKYNNWNYPIKASNNDRDGLGFNESPGSTKLYIVGQSDTAWSSITNGARTGGFSAPTSKWRLPNEADWRYLSTDCKQGYGVCYGDGATTTAETVANAYGYVRNNNNSSAKGMRGCFVYKTDGRNMFLPIGKSGYGVRNEGHSQGGNDDGVLRYGSPYQLLSGWGTTYAPYRPMLDDLYAQEGAIYWMNNSHGDAWDINYRTMDFNIYIADDNDENQQGNGWDYGEGTASTHKIPSDACFIRLVDVER